jgi:hypothetical protein
MPMAVPWVALAVCNSRIGEKWRVFGGEQRVVRWMVGERAGANGLADVPFLARDASNLVGTSREWGIALLKAS